MRQPITGVGKAMKGATVLTTVVQQNVQIIHQNATLIRQMDYQSQVLYAIWQSLPKDNSKPDVPPPTQHQPIPPVHIPQQR